MSLDRGNSQVESSCVEQTASVALNTTSFFHAQSNYCEIMLKQLEGANLQSILESLLLRFRFTVLETLLFRLRVAVLKGLFLRLWLCFSILAGSQ